MIRGPETRTEQLQWYPTEENWSQRFWPVTFTGEGTNHEFTAEDEEEWHTLREDGDFKGEKVIAVAYFDRDEAKSYATYQSLRVCGLFCLLGITIPCCPPQRRGRNSSRVCSNQGFLIMIVANRWD